MDHDRQNQLIVEQFTAQAEPFAAYAPHSDEDAMRLVREAAGIGPEDVVLDVACGPGLVACDFARYAKRVTGVDITPGMIDQARKLQASRGLANVDWRVSDVSRLPFEDAAFTVVFSRYAFHHLLEPSDVLREMARVCRPGGRVVVVDVYSQDPKQGAAYDAVEKLRDPSHTKALSLDDFAALYESAGLAMEAPKFYGLDVKLDDLLQASDPEPGADDEVRRIFRADLGVDRLGVNARVIDGEIWFTFPIVVMVGRRP
ncbi:class I SAM-dependent methyltransferase [Paludisphaera rhizosphaerae]|uniref:class I SAM-dependent methyltransferase n=1 Tax=Paludisphaera rhizosphaerae TaxID=2711216 RepID=UPI0013ED0DDF|nr:class I SAM-dependent methyltransferase [Paludisphaera rhizosphaerae]